MARPLDILLSRTKLALGSLALVEKQLDCILADLTTASESFMLNPIRGEEKNSDQDFFISPPLEVYDGQQ